MCIVHGISRLRFWSPTYKHCLTQQYAVAGNHTRNPLRSNFKILPWFWRPDFKILPWLDGGLLRVLPRLRGAFQLILPWLWGQLLRILPFYTRKKVNKNGPPKRAISVDKIRCGSQGQTRTDNLGRVCTLPVWSTSRFRSATWLFFIYKRIVLIFIKCSK